MRIDWFTFAAQAVNFLLLVYLLKRFLYGRIVSAMRSREEQIAGRLEAGERAKEEARREAERYRRMQQDLDERRAALLSQARQEAEARRRELLARAREEADELLARRQAALRQESEALARMVRERAEREVFAVSRKVLRELAGTDLEVRAVRVFLENLRRTDDRKLREMRRGGGVIAVRSSFPLPLDTQKNVIDELRRHLNADNGVQFEVFPGLVCGIELSAGGKTVSWNVGDYLDALERRVRDALLGEEAAAGTGEKEGRVHAGV